ncbi:MAG: hypothetical protein EOP48_06015 [Sphingobacteriales bacterium]|nr:MAG: hypothetical protein EOP48_06015 [Sphingobacteriales bacterium]
MERRGRVGCDDNQGLFRWSAGFIALERRVIPLERRGYSVGAQGLFRWSAGLFRWSAGAITLERRGDYVGAQGLLRWSAGAITLERRGKKQVIHNKSQPKNLDTL